LLSVERATVAGALTSSRAVAAEIPPGANSPPRAKPWSALPPPPSPLLLPCSPPMLPEPALLRVAGRCARDLAAAAMPPPNRRASRALLRPYGPRRRRRRCWCRCAAAAAAAPASLGPSAVANCGASRWARSYLVSACTGISACPCSTASRNSSCTPRQKCSRPRYLPHHGPPPRPPIRDYAPRRRRGDPSLGESHSGATPT
jgi:hypothetical protein